MFKTLVDSFSVFKNKIHFHLWIYFFIFLVSNTLISYFPLSLSAKLWVGLFGLALPFTVALTTILKQRLKFQRNFTTSIKFLTPPSQWKDPPIWLWFLFIFLLLLTRFYRLTSLPFWPHLDDGTPGFLAMGQMRQWHWNILWGQVRFEPMIIWTLCLFFKIVPPSLFSLRFYSVFISIATAFTAYWAARTIFSKWTSFFFCWLLTFSFWELTISRFCFMGDWVTLFQLLCGGLLSLLLKTKNLSIQWIYLWLLSFCAGIGFYTWTVWLSVWFCLTVVLLWNFFHLHSKEKSFPFIFISISLFIAIPLVIARLAPGGMAHILKSAGAFPLQSIFYYLIGIFWNYYPGFAYRFNWGGFLNPLLDSLIFIGTLVLFKTASKSFFIGMIVCLFISLLPGIMTNGMELYRIMAIFPLLTVLAVAGLLNLIPGKWNFKSICLVVILLLGLFILDIYDYIDRYCDIRFSPPEIQERSVPYAEAYEMLKQKSKVIGPIYVFSQFNAVSEDMTLNVACYPFDALENPKFSNSRPAWIALLVKIDFTPYLMKRFPGTQYKFLSPEKSNHLPDGLFFIPVSQLGEQNLLSWIQAEQLCWNMNLDLTNNSPSQSWSSFAETLIKNKAEFSSDHFLKTIFWEKIGILRVMDKDLISGRSAYQSAITEGIPLPHLYHNEGLCDELLGDQIRAEKAFQRSDQLGDVFEKFLKNSR